MKMIFALLIFGSVPSLATEDCETQATISPVEGYMRLVRRGLNLQELKVEEVERLSERDVPTMPELLDRRTGNLSLRDGFTRVMRVLKPKHWPQVVAELKQEIEKQTIYTAQVQSANEVTRPVFAALRTKYQLPRSAILKRTFVTHDGGIFVFAANQTNTNSYVYDLRSGAQIEIKDFEGEGYLVDFLETSSGQLAFAYIKGSSLNVVDVRTQAPLLEKNFTSVLDSRFTFRNGRNNYAPYLFESNGKLKVLVGYTATIPPVKEGKIPLYIFDVEAQTATTKLVMAGKDNNRMARLTNNRLYFIGTAKPESISVRSEDEQIFAYDIAEDKYHINLRTSLVGNSYQAYLFNGPQPQMVFTPYSNAANQNWYLVSPEDERLSLLRTTPVSNERKLIQLSDHSLWIFNVIYDQQLNAGGIFSVIPLNQDSSSPPLVENLKIEGFRSFQHLRWKQKDIFVAHQRTDGTETLYFYDRNFNELGRAQFSYELDGVPDIPFVDPSNGRIYAFVHRTSSPRVLYQLYGPEELR